MRTHLTRIVPALFLTTIGCAGGGPGGGGDDGPDASLGAEDLIDDLEDGDDAITEASGRMGGWYTFNDGTMGGTQTPPSTGFTPSAGGAGDSAFAAVTTGDGFDEWGAGMGFDLNNPSAVGQTGDRGPYDATRYATLAFQARGNAKIRVALETTGLVPADRGGTCVPGTMEGTECEDLHGSDITLTDEWKEYQLPFDQLRQAGWGQEVAFDATTVVAVLFMVDKGVAFDIAVDDVRFYE
jgi:hypothetical protein